MSRNSLFPPKAWEPQNDEMEEPKNTKMENDVFLFSGNATETLNVLSSPETGLREEGLLH